MVMSKAEQADMNALKKVAREARALRFIDYELPRLVPMSQLQTGWTFNAYSRSVYEGCFTTSGHSVRQTNRTDTQNSSGPWYALKSDAIKALRMKVQQEFAEILAHLDQKTEDALKQEKEDAA